MRLAQLFCIVVGLGLMVGKSSALNTAQAIEVIRKVGPEGQGNAEASSAWQQLATGSAASIVEILEGMTGASPVALNWLRSAVESIAARDQELPMATLERFLRQTSHHPKARRLAYELIAQANPKAAETMIGTMLNDPSNELRRDAVERLRQEAGSALATGQKEAAIAQYQRALQSAREVDQIEGLAKKLEELGQPVNLAEVFGWLTEWKVIGPFDSTKGAGFERVFPPENELNWEAEYEGKSSPVRWVPLQVASPYGLVDLNKPLGMLKGVAGYAYTEIQAKEARSVELRLGSKNAWKVWCNGKFLFGRDEYHRGSEIDQYRLKVDLKPGKNVILVKVCQNEQTEDWTKEWEFQMRITDDLGTPITFAKD